MLSDAQPLDCYPALPLDGYKLLVADSLGVAGLFDAASLELAGAWRQEILRTRMRRACLLPGL